MGGGPLDEEQMTRQQRVQLSAEPDRYLYVYTPEGHPLQSCDGPVRGRGVGPSMA